MATPYEGKTLMRMLISGLLLGVAAASAANAQSIEYNKSCGVPQSIIKTVQQQLAIVVNLSDDNGGIFTPNMMWSAIVDRKGLLCSVIKTGDAWPGSRAIAIAKAETANDFSNDKLALSTANLYAPTQPGGSLYGLNNSNPFNPASLVQGSGLGGVPGGVITFGGGVALYENGKVVGGLGVSGDSSCADHAIAFRMRQLSGYNVMPGGSTTEDNIIYGPPYDGFQQPHCFPQDLTPQQVINIPPH
jgi:uncharacterized protein GlcG (DUF336 family)